jgi:hypothetical protein
MQWPFLEMYVNITLGMFQVPQNQNPSYNVGFAAGRFWWLSAARHASVLQLNSRGK